MDKIKSHLFFRIICIVLIATFIALDISWAYPPEPASPNHNLAAQSAFQQQMMTGEAQKFQQSIFSNITLLTSVYSVGKYLLGDPEQGTEPLPLKYLESTLTAELGKTLEGIDLSKAVVKDSVIIVPYEKQGKKYVIQIALKNSASAKDLIGYEWVVSDKYVVKAVPEGYIEPTISPAKSKEEPEVTITEPIAEVTADEIKTPEDVDMPRRPSRFIIRAIVASILLIMLTPSKLFAGTEDRGTVLYSFKDFIFAHPAITAVVALGVGVGVYMVYYALAKANKKNQEGLEQNKARAPDWLLRLYSFLTNFVAKYRKPMVVATILATIMGVFVACEEAYKTTPKESIKVSAPASPEFEALSKEIKQLVKGLEYSDKVAQDFAQMVGGWKDAQGRPVLVVWKNKLAESKEAYKQGKISKAQLAKVEESIAKEIGQRIQKEISYNVKFFDLADVVKHRQTQCLGYTQLFYLLGNPIGLPVKAINVLEAMTPGPLQAGVGHIACIVNLADDKTIMIDLIPGGFISTPFIIEKELTKVGNYWELKEKDNPLGIHRRVQTLDRNGLIASIYNNRGVSYAALGQRTKAISDYTKAIELNPKLAEAYTNRGVSYAALGQHTKAISDYIKTIELNPKYPEAYYNRGNAYFDLGQHTKAISDHTKAVELNPKFAEAYNNRGAAYAVLGQHTKAISDYTKAVEFNPKDALAYYNRGNVYFGLGQHTQGISDYTKAIELNPKYAEAYRNRGVAYATLGKFEETKKDLLKAVELKPALKPLVKRVSDLFKLGLKLDSSSGPTIKSINPFVIGLSIAGLASILSSLKDFVFAHPVITAVAALGVGIGAFFVIWRVFFPVRWYSRRLRNRNSSVRKSAAEALEKLGALTTKRKVKRYIADLSDKRLFVLTTAVETLGKIGPEAKAAIPALIGLLVYKYVRKSAAEALGKIGKPAVPVLIKALGDEDIDVLICAAKVLGEIGPEAKAAIPALIKALGDKKYVVRKTAAEALGNIGPAAKAAAPALIKALGDEDIDVRKSAAEALGKIGKSAVPALIKALVDKDSDVRQSAVETLGEIGPEAKDAVPALIKALVDERINVCMSATEALGNIGPATKDVVPALIETLGDENAYVRKTAAEALGKIGPAAKAAAPALIKALVDERINVRMNATEALGNIGPATKDVVPALIETLGDENAYVRKTAAEALGKIGPAAKAAAPALIKALRDERPYVRKTAAEALGNIGPAAKAAVPVLIKALVDKDDFITHKAAAEALGKIGKSAVPALIKALEDEYTCEVAAEALGKIGPTAKDAVPLLIRTLEDGDWYYVREAAAEALGKIGPDAKEAIPALIKALVDERINVRMSAAYALGEIGPAAKEAVPTLIKTLGDESWECRRTAAEALGKIGPAAKDAVPALIKALGDEYHAYVREPAAEALGEIGDLRAIEPLRKAGYESISEELEKQLKKRKSPKTDHVSQLFEIVETAVNNERTEFVNTGNQLVSSLAERDDLQDKVDTQKLDKGRATAEIKEQIERIVAVVDQLDRETLTEDIASQISLLKKNLDQFEADGIVAAIIALARKAKRENQNLIIGLETEWIPGYQKRTLQHNAINSLIKELESLEDTLRDIGLDNVLVVHSKSDELASDLLREADRTSTKLSNVVVLASNATINSDKFAPLRSTPGEEKAFLAGVDAAELINFYRENGESLDRQLCIQLMEMLSIMLELALGKDAPNLPIIVTYDKALRTVIFLPKPKPLDYQELQRFYKLKKLALHSA